MGGSKVLSSPERETMRGADIAAPHGGVDVSYAASSAVCAEAPAAELGLQRKASQAESEDSAALVGGGRFWFGVFCTLLGGTLWGVSGSVSQLLMGTYHVDPLFISVFREIGASIILLAIMAVRYRGQFPAMVRDRGSLLRVIVFGVALFACQITYLVAIGLSNAGTVTVLQSANVIIIMVAACLIGRTLPHLVELLGLIAAIVATWLIATGGDIAALVLPLPALLWGLGTAVAAAVYTMYPQKLFVRWGSMCVTAGGMSAGAIVAILVACGLALAGDPVPWPTSLDAFGWAMLVFIAAVGTFGAFALFLHGVSIVGSVKGSLLGCIEPVSATVVSALWLGTAFSGADIVGLVLMIAAVFLVTLKPQKS